MTNYKIFNGKKYYFAADMGYKKGADELAKINKAEGKLARITKYLDKLSKKYRYEVWVRKGN